MLVMLGILEAGLKKIKERKGAVGARRTGGVPSKAGCTCFFSSGRFPITFFGFAGRKDQWKQQQQGEKETSRSPRPLGPGLVPSSRRPRAVLAAWCLVLGAARSPLPMGYQPRPPILSLGRCHTHPNPALGSGLALLLTLVDVSGAGQLSTGAPCREKVGGLLTNTQRREAR